MIMLWRLLDSPASTRRSSSRLYLPLALFILLAFWHFNGLHGILGSLPDLGGSDGNIHPVEAAISASEQAFVKLLTKQSQSIAAANAEYIKRYGIEPPPHFDRWFQLAQQNDFILIDEFDTIMESIKPFRALLSSQIRRVLELALAQAPDQLLRYEIRDGKFSAEVGSKSSWFADSMRSFLPMDWLSLVPDMTLAINVYDEPQVVIPKPIVDQLMTSASASTHVSDALDSAFQDYGRQNAWSAIKLGCLPTAAAVNASKCAVEQKQQIGVITNLTASQDVCAQCDFRHHEGFLLSPDRLSLTHLPIPILSQAKPSIFNDVLFPSPHYWGIASHETVDRVTWEDKQNRLYWTGSATGGYATKENWQHMQRQRLALKLKHGSSGPIRLLKQDSSEQWLPYNTTLEEIERIVDVRITGTTMQCDPSVCEEERQAFGIETAEVKDPEDLVHAYKFLLDIDGNSFSGRFYRLLRTNSVVLKKSIFKEWHQDRLIPWVHFIPISSSSDELPEVVRFLAKTDTGDALARKVALNSRDWAERALRHVDMQLVLLRILLELGRIIKD